MTPEQDNHSESATGQGEQQLCVNCMTPNEVSAHFCTKCRAPLSSYASTGPFESVFAEGAVYRQAAERPRSFIVVFGVWLFFGMLGLVGLTMLVMARDIGIANAAFGAFMLVIAVVLIWKSTRNYWARPRTDEQHDG